MDNLPIRFMKAIALLSLASIIPARVPMNPINMDVIVSELVIRSLNDLRSNLKKIAKEVATIEPAMG